LLRSPNGRRSIGLSYASRTQILVIMDDCPYVLIPSFTIHPDRINLYSSIDWIYDIRKKSKFKTLINQSKAHNNKVSNQAARKITKAVSYLLLLANDKKVYSHMHGKQFKFKISFITLTLSSKQNHDDNTIKKELLNHFLIEAKKKWNVSNYIWRAEKQTNGNIHFHILTDKFIPWSELRDTWNRIQNKLNYVNEYRNNMRAYFKNGFRLRSDIIKHWNEQSQRKAYRKGVSTDWASPNSTDVHSLQFVSKIEKYITKYLKKQEQTGITVGRLWGCSSSLSNITGAKGEICSTVDNEIAIIKEKLKPHIYNHEHFTVIFVNIFEIVKLNLPILTGCISTYLYEHFNYSIQLIT
jgi:hypothetical protein